MYIPSTKTLNNTEIFPCIFSAVQIYSPLSVVSAVKDRTLWL